MSVAVVIARLERVEAYCVVGNLRLGDVGFVNETACRSCAVYLYSQVVVIWIS